MIDKLEKFIIDHRNEFDIYEPSAHVWDGIVKETHTIKKRRINWRGTLWKVAAAVIIFISAFSLSEFIHRSKDTIAQKDDNIEKEIIIPELIEAEVYYAGEVNMRMSEIKSYAAINPDLEREMNYDLSELDSIYADIKRDLKDNIATEEVVDALIQNYRLKLQILEEILHQLQKSEKLQDDERTRYEL